MPTTVMVFGTFDALHEGHLNLFKQAKALGDRLIVVVSRDATTNEVKGHTPQKTELQRLAAVQQTAGVDLAILGSAGADKHAVIVERKPDIIALGYDQYAFV